MDITKTLLDEMNKSFDVIDISDENQLRKYLLSQKLVIESLVEENVILKKKLSYILDKNLEDNKSKEKSKVGPKRQTKSDLKEIINQIKIDNYRFDETHLFLIYDINILKITLDDIPKVMILIENLKIVKEDFSYIEKIVNEKDIDITEKKNQINFSELNDKELHNYFIINKDRLNEIFNDYDEKQIKEFLKKIGGSLGRGNLKNKSKIILKFKEFLEETNDLDSYLLSFKNSHHIIEIKSKLEFLLSLKNDSYEKNDSTDKDDSIELEISDISSKKKLCSNDLRLCHDSWSNPKSFNKDDTLLSHYKVFSSIDDKMLGQMRKVIDENDAPLVNHINKQKFIVCVNMKYNDIDYFVCVITGQCIKLKDYKVNQPSLVNERIYITNNEDNCKVSITDNGLNFDEINDSSVNYIIGKEEFDSENKIHIIDISRNLDNTYNTYVLKKGSENIYRKKSIQLKRQGRNYVKV